MFFAGRSEGSSSRCKKCHGLADRKCIQCGSVFLGKYNVKLCSAECKKNRRPRTHHNCANCGSSFPVDRLASKLCSLKCKSEFQTLLPEDRKPRQKRTREAGRANGRISYLIKTGRIARPAKCEDCGVFCKPDGAHHDYSEPEKVRWLCVSCHRKWDNEFPKNGTIKN